MSIELLGEILRGGGGGGGVTSYIWHSTDVRAEWPPFFSAARYMMIGPLFSTTSICLTQFFHDWYMKGPTFSDIPVYAHIFHSEIFEAACSLGIQ